MGKVIAIDGPSGAGKSTIAKLIARELGFDYLDTGALYRAVAFALRKVDIDIKDDDKKIMDLLLKVNISFNNGRVFLNGRDISSEIRSREIDYYSSVFSTKKIVRDFLLTIQRKLATINNIVVEGRDTTTVAFPDAWKKIYLDASPDERAKRRYLQFKDKAIYATMDEAKREVIERDRRDSNRDIAPLKKAEDAFFIDSSNMSVEQAKEEILRFIKT
ncbi:MAG: (d)CMP kinase [Nitrospirae bacterium]|nr:(d)CMP kinase [Nitrospirota bacterium]